MSRVYVVTGINLGWDCVCGVFKSLRSAEDYVLGIDDGQIVAEEDRNKLIDESDRIIHNTYLED